MLASPATHQPTRFNSNAEQHDKNAKLATQSYPKSESIPIVALQPSALFSQKRLAEVLILFYTEFYGGFDADRMDGLHLEPGDGLHEDHVWLRLLLRGAFR